MSLWIQQVRGKASGSFFAISVHFEGYPLIHCQDRKGGEISPIGKQKHIFIEGRVSCFCCWPCLHILVNKKIKKCLELGFKRISSPFVTSYINIQDVTCYICTGPLPLWLSACSC